MGAWVSKVSKVSLRSEERQSARASEQRVLCGFDRLFDLDADRALSRSSVARDLTVAVMYVADL